MSVGGEVVDLGFRVAYRAAHRMLRAYWRVRRPHTQGALIAVWYEDALLLVKNSYRAQYTLPGGYVHANETVTQAGARELREEVGLAVTSDEVAVAYNSTKWFENRKDEVTILEVEAKTRPEFRVDNREVVWAGFKPTRAALAMSIVPHLREYLESRTNSPPLAGASSDAT